MDVERLPMIGALVQLQNQNLLSLKQTDGKWRRKKGRQSCVVRQWIQRRPKLHIPFNQKSIRTSIKAIFSSVVKSSLLLNQLKSPAEPTPACPERHTINARVTAKATLATARYS